MIVTKLPIHPQSYITENENPGANKKQAVASGAGTIFSEEYIFRHFGSQNFILWILVHFGTQQDDVFSLRLVFFLYQWGWDTIFRVTD